jgi:hypothetical protein
MTDTDASDKSKSRRKRRGSGPFQANEQEILQAEAEARARSSAADKPDSLGADRPLRPKFGRYERPDFERVESMLASFAARRLTPFMQQVQNGFFGAASPAEKQNQELQTAFYSFFLYGYRDPKGIRVVDLFAGAGIPVEGRQRAALDACLQARLGLVAVEDINPGKQRLRGKDLLRAEPVTLLDKNLSQVIAPGDRLLSWQIPWGTSWQPIGVVQRVEARKAHALDRAIETLCNSLRAVRPELPERHAANLFWLVHRVANMPIG